MIIQVIQLSGQELTCACFRRLGRHQLVPISGFKHAFTELPVIVPLIRENLPPATTEEIRTILSVPPSLVSLREVSLPAIDRSKLRAVLPLELANDIAQPDLNFVCDAIQLGDGSWLAGWADTAPLTMLISLLTDAGCEPEVITLGCLHWHLLLSSSSEELVALCDQNAVSVCKAGASSPLFCRCLGDTDADLARTLIALELGRGLHVSTVYCLEPGLSANTPPGVLLENIPVPSLLDQPDAAGTLPPIAMAAPLAVAMAYCSGEIFNLRSGPLTWSHQRTHLLRRHRIPLLLGALVLLLLLVESGVRWYLLSRDVVSLNASIAKIYREILPTRKKAVDEVAEIKAEIRRLQGGFASQSPLTFLNMLAGAKGEEIYGLNEVNFDGNRFHLKGEARNGAAVASFRQRLLDKGLAADQPDITTKPDGTVLFVVRGQHGGTKP